MMHRHGIRAIMAKPRRVRTTDSRHGLPIVPNLIARNFTAEAPNRVWLADITYIPTAEGWLYLAAVMDLFSRRIVGWAMRDTMQVELASAALTMAIQQRRPQAGLIHHSDRGVQYASHAYRQTLSAAGITPSMSRKADCYDNAPMESFFHTLKTELVHHRDYNTRAEARRDIFAFIEGFYNRTRTPFCDRIHPADPDGAESRLNPSTFSGEDHDQVDWQIALEALVIAAERDGDVFIAWVAVVRALNQVFHRRHRSRQNRRHQSRQGYALSGKMHIRVLDTCWTSLKRAGVSA